MGIALLAPSYLSVHGGAVEAIRRYLFDYLSAIHQDSRIVVLDQSFWSKSKATESVINRLWRADIRGLFLLIRYGQPMKMRHQIETVMRNLYKQNKSIPAMPLCIFVHGHEAVGEKEKRRIKLLYRIYLAQQNLPKTMASNRSMIQIRHCHSKTLRKDKVKDTMDWMSEHMKSLRIWDSESISGNHKFDAYFELPSSQRSKSPQPSLRSLRTRRSSSLPKVQPTNRYPAAITCSTARKTVNLTFKQAVLQATLRQGTHGLPWTSSVEHCALSERACYLDDIFTELTGYRDRAYEILSRRLRYMKNQGVSKPRTREFFFTHFSWAEQVWSRKVTHVVVTCDLAGVQHQQIMKLKSFLSPGELKILRAYILEYYAATGKSLHGKFIKNIHRSASVHEVACNVRDSKSVQPGPNDSLQTVHSKGLCQVSYDQRNLFKADFLLIDGQTPSKPLFKPIPNQYLEKTSL